jgi:HlyD family secretion protein
VKLSVPPERILPVIERIKTGIRGVGYVRLDDSAAWPERLDRPFPGPVPAPPAAAGKPEDGNVSEGQGAPTARPETPAPRS